SSDTPPASAQINWTFNDNNSGAQGTGGALTATGSTIVSITAVNDEQFIATNSTKTVAENSTGNTIANTFLLTSDLDNTASQLVYTITTATANGTLRKSGSALGVSSTFTQADIDGGLITYDHNGTETSSDSFAFSVDDGVGSTSTGTFNLTITPLNDNNPVISSNGGGVTASINIAENSTAVTTVVASDADLPGPTITYSISGADASLFSIGSSSGVLTFVSGRNRESHTDADSNGVYEVTVQASDGTLTDTQAISVTITDVDEFDVGSVTDSNATANSVAENASIGTAVGITATASDADATTNTITYSLQSSDGGNFAIDANTGVVTVAAALNRETLGASRNITVRATSADGSYTDQAFTINLTDVDEFDVSTPTDSNGTANAVNENASNGTTVGITATASDSDATTNTVTYSLFSDAGGRFAIDANTGIVTVANGTLLNREAAASHNITVRATSADGSTADTVFTININDLDEFDVGTVTDSNATGNSVAENASIGTAVGITASASDADATTNTITYSLQNNDGGRFAIDANTGVVT
ncbi:MAG: cadherin domain-containing protein, partial [Pirellula sp.]